MRSAKREHETAKLDMTPMIDVVFQLLIFFIVTTVEEDLLSQLKVLRPAGVEITQPPDEAIELLDIMIWREGYVLQGTRVSLETVERRLRQLAELSLRTTIVIKCEMQSPHDYLIKVLDACAAAKLSNISVFSF
jgi:biopolymer transport protein ExbD